MNILWIPSIFRTHTPLFPRSQILTDLSSDAERIYFPLWWKITLFTHPSCPANVITLSPQSAFQTLISLSQLPVTMKSILTTTYSSWEERSDTFCSSGADPSVQAFLIDASHARRASICSFFLRSLEESLDSSRWSWESSVSSVGFSLFSSASWIAYAISFADPFRFWIRYLVKVTAAA